VLLKKLLLPDCLCLFMLAQPGFAQAVSDPQQLQTSGIALIDHWLNYHRRTGDATGSLSNLTTATGKAQETHASEALGIVRSLLYSGAGTLVLSAWEVNAASTQLWMETFYREGQSKAPAEAARLALVAVKSRPEYSHPFYWAPFVVTGK